MAAIVFAYAVLAVVLVMYVVRVNYLRRHPVSLPSRRRSRLMVGLTVAAAAAGIGIAMATDGHRPSLGAVLSATGALIAVAAFAHWRFTASSSARDG